METHGLAHLPLFHDGVKEFQLLNIVIQEIAACSANLAPQPALQIWAPG